MDWDVIRASAEVFGTIAVVVSLIYVAIQIRQNTRATKLATAQNLSQDFRGVLSPLYSDSEVSRIYLDAMADVEALDGHERFRAYVFTQGYLRTLENAYYQYANGAVDEYVWEGLRSNLQFSKGTSVHKAFWADRQHIFSQQFRSFYESLDEGDPNAPVAPYRRNDE
jgi:hypothetical protein